jgi:hypothetical protein
MARAPAIAPLRIDTLRLEPGSHASPGDGVCIVELASILGEERFSDEPDCVCVVIGAFLRSWNDRASYSDRQRLLPYAEQIVGTRGGRAITRRRRDICLVWSELADLDGGPVSRSLSRLRARLRVGWLLGPGPALRLSRGAGEYAAGACFARHGSEASFRLLDRLLEAGGDTTRPAVNGNGQPNGNGNGASNGNGHRASRDFVRAVIRAREGGRKDEVRRRVRSGDS